MKSSASSASRNKPGAPVRDHAAWALLAFNLLLVLAIQLRLPLTVEPASLLTLAFATAALCGAAVFYSTVRHRPEFSAMCVSLNQILLFSAVGSILSYLLAREGGALQDDLLTRWDRSLGFDWLAYVQWVDGFAPLVLLFKLAYASLVPQIILIVIVQGFSGRIGLMRQTILAAMLCGTITILLSPLWPAESNFVHLNLKITDFRNIDPYAGYIHLAHFEALRNGSLTHLSLKDAQGIITFPSYHAGLAMVTLWSFWKTPWIRWPGIAVALLTIAATPVDGGHYLVDVIAGCAIATASIAVAKRAAAWCAFPVRSRRSAVESQASLA